MIKIYFIFYLFLKIENLRVQMAQLPGLDPTVLFEILDADRDGCITPEELQAFLVQHSSLATPESCREVIREYDATNQGSLGYEEFLNIFLPTANMEMRNKCLYGYR